MRALGVWCLLCAACGSRELEVSWTYTLDEEVGFVQQLAYSPGGDLAVVVGRAGGCFELRGLTGSGLQMWRRPFHEALPDELLCPEFATLAVDREGHIIAVGGAAGASSATKSQAFVRKLDGKGSVLWTHLVDGGRGGHDGARSVAVDRDGNVLVGGSEQQAFESAPWIVKLAPDGAPQWTLSQFARTNHALQADRAGDFLAITPPSNIVQDQVAPKATIEKRDAGGTWLWDVDIQTQSRFGQVFFALHPDGWSAAVTTTNQVVRISADGEIERAARLTSLIEADDGARGSSSPRAVGIAGDGTIVVAGEGQVERCSGCAHHGLSIQLFTPEGELYASRFFEPIGPWGQLQLASFAVRGHQAAAIVIGDRGVFLVAISLPDLPR